jgi:hypothetical protein
MEPEALLQRIDANATDADVIDDDARLLGLFHRAQDIRPRVLPFVAFVGRETVSEGQEDPSRGPEQPPDVTIGARAV